jgi:prevent-host-death family protein
METKERRALVNLTEHVQRFVADSGVREGFCLVSAMSGREGRGVCLHSPRSLTGHRSERIIAGGPFFWSLEQPLGKTLPISEVKARLPELVRGVDEREEEVVVTRKGRPAAVLVGYEEYTRLRETLEVLTDPVLMRQIRESRRFYARKRRGLSFADVFGEPLAGPKKRSRG